MALIDEIKARFPALTPDTRDDGAIAAALSAGRVKLIPTRIGYGVVLDVLGPVVGATVLDVLTGIGGQNPTVRWAMKLLDTATLDVSLASTRGQLDALVGSVLTAEQVATLKALAEVPDPVSPQQVAYALEGA